MMGGPTMNLLLAIFFFFLLLVGIGIPTPTTTVAEVGNAAVLHGHPGGGCRRCRRPTIVRDAPSAARGSGLARGGRWDRRR